MKALAVLVFVLTVASAPSAEAADFRRLAMSIAGDFFIDTRSIDDAVAVRSATVLTVWPDDFDEDVEVELRRIEFDCAAYRTRTASSRTYTLEMTLKRDTRDPGPWEAVTDGSVGRVLWGFVCRGEVPQDVDSQTYRSARAAAQATVQEFRE
ncbi:surface-adhesin E family protein [Brevundimonas sp.]|uniref:surface-adhesin E family protein n=1 Tax=Brevundimonas sp. TaxID=1871086 RepID=UPI002D6E2C24|nr:surface-adhesin E family protein [Brevundimonas sp.]HYC67525.1 surface-adhesin E family protein [Brevundimonas sp.]